jgi:LAGLIDADG DNA endonuclease family
MNNNINKMKNNDNLTDSMSLVLWWNNLSSTTKIKYTKHELSIVKLPENIRSIIIGIVLSDGHIALTSRSKNAYLMFSQSLAKLGYIYFVFNFLNHYCQSYPKLIVSLGWGKTTYKLLIATRSMPSITELHEYFYEKKNKDYQTFYLFLYYTYCNSSLNYG